MGNEFIGTPMMISGFTFVRNATRLYYPVQASIRSILPLVDEFVVALGAGDPDDKTREAIEAIGSPKIRILDTQWDLTKYGNGTEYAHQTDIAKDACRGDWLFYIQCDEAIHEKYHAAIRRRCEELLGDLRVEGLVFRYKHFWGDYAHHIVSHAWYPREIRIVRNLPTIHSWRDAQSFRWMPGFDGLDYYRHKKTRKLRVAAVDAWVYHYGWVRPPDLMQRKRVQFSIAKRGEAQTGKMFSGEGERFDYGDLGRLAPFTESHPAVMKEWIEDFHWREQLFPQRPLDPSVRHKHEKLKYRLLTFVEQNLLGGRMIGGFRNYKLLDV